MNLSVLKVTVALTEDIHFKDISYKISNLINHSMLKDDNLKKLHKSNEKFKHYSFSNFQPIEMDKIYRKGYFYTFEMKSSKSELLEKFKKVLDRTIFENMVVYSVKEEEITIKVLNEIISVTPVVITKDNKCYDKRNIIILKNTISKNAIRKCNEIYDLNIDENHEFIDNIEIISHQPIVTNYKKGIFIGNKLKMSIKEDMISQKIGQVILGSGLGEKNSQGMGYCKGFH